MAGYGRHRTVWAAAGGAGKQGRKARQEAGLRPRGAPGVDAAAAPATATAATAATAAPADTAASTSPPAPISGWSALRNELAKDFSRLWRRNLGRDDRVIGDSGREARHPFLDEHLLALLHRRLPLRSVADLSLPPGVGDKQILRQVAQACGLDQSARLVKRAMQFGSRIANKKVAGYVTMHAGVKCRDIVNPFFLRAEAGDGGAGAASPPGSSAARAAGPPVPTTGAAAAAATAAPYVRAAPDARLDKRVQKAQRRVAAAAAAAAAIAAPSAPVDSAPAAADSLPPPIAAAPSSAGVAVAFN